MVAYNLFQAMSLIMFRSRDLPEKRRFVVFMFGKVEVVFIVVSVEKELEDQAIPNWIFLCNRRKRAGLQKSLSASRCEDEVY